MTCSILLRSILGLPIFRFFEGGNDEKDSGGDSGDPSSDDRGDVGGGGELGGISDSGNVAEAILRRYEDAVG